MPTPEPDGIDAVWLKYSENHETQLRDRLIYHYAPLVKYVSGRIGSSVPASVDTADLISNGMLGLIEAIDRFNPERGIKFETFAMPRIRGAMLDELRGLDWLPRTLRAKNRSIVQVVARLQAELQRSPTVEEIAEAVELSVAEVKDAIDADSLGRVGTLSQPLSDDDRETASDRLIDREAMTPEDLLSDQESLASLSGLISQLSQREQIIVALYYYEGLTLAEIGQILNVSESRISQLHSRIMKKLQAFATSPSSTS